jgi:hypothetical protein
MNPTTPNPVALLKMRKDGSEQSLFLEEFRESGDNGAFLVSEGRILSTAREETRIQAHSLSTGEQTWLVASNLPYLTLRSASDGFLYYSEYLVDDPDGDTSHFSRVSMSGGLGQRLHHRDFANQVLAADGYLYWDSMGLLLRQPL